MITRAILLLVAAGVAFGLLRHSCCSFSGPDLRVPEPCSPDMMKLYLSDTAIVTDDIVIRGQLHRGDHQGLPSAEEAAGKAAPGRYSIHWRLVVTS